MGAISLEKVEHLYWLGRYTERVFTTLQKFFEVYDNMIDEGIQGKVYPKYCECLSIPNIYTSNKDFAMRYLFDKKNPDSLAGNMERAYDNGIVLREELSSEVLSYLQMSLDLLASAAGSGAPLFTLQPLVDDIYAFWGCVDDEVDNRECRNIMKVGRRVERLDLYLRLSYGKEETGKELSKLIHRIKETDIRFNEEKLERVIEIVNQDEIAKEERREAVRLVGEIVEVM
ncbi:MAG: alpha-E domain-containing protein [Hespellia sp.]|nr:alpha-E domain-containing protein [Hespellia sp.]